MLEIFIVLNEKTSKNSKGRGEPIVPKGRGEGV